MNRDGDRHGGHGGGGGHHDEPIDVRKSEEDFFVQKEILCYVVPNPQLAGREINEKHVFTTLQTNEMFGKDPKVNDLNSNVSAVRFPRSGDNLGFNLFTIQSPELVVNNVYQQFYEKRRELRKGLTIYGEDKDANRIELGEIKHVSPNWFIGSAYHTGLGTHGPGGPPRAITDDMLNHLRFNFSDPFTELNAPSPNAACNDVVVYILDTIPKRDRIKTTLSHPNWQHLSEYYKRILEEQGAAVPNQYVTERATYHYSEDVGCDLSPAYIPKYRLDEIGADYDHTSPGPYSDDPYALGTNHYDSSDHGLFIAGIIHMIAPSVKIHVLQVIADNGAGTFASYATGYRKVIDIHQQYPTGTKAIVNCSFTLAIPIDGHDEDELTGQQQLMSARVAAGRGHVRPILDLNTYANQHGGFKPQLEDLISAIEASITQIGATIVAASGNDSDRRNTSKPAAKRKKKARYPAHFKNVVGVGALQRNLNQAADYSNEPDEPDSDGFMVFGGDYDNDLRKVTANGKYPDSGQGIISIFTANLPIQDNTFPIPVYVDAPQENNLNGFAEWKGTSFATPVLVGTIAALCCQKNLSVSEALAQIHGASEVAADKVQTDKLKEFRSVVQVHDTLVNESSK